jgi:hypothetical protein
MENNTSEDTCVTRQTCVKLLSRGQNWRFIAQLKLQLTSTDTAQVANYSLEECQTVMWKKSFDIVRCVGSDAWTQNWDSPEEEGSGKEIGTKDTYVKDDVAKQMGTSCCSHECSSWAVHDRCAQHKNILRKYVWKSVLVIVNQNI